MEPFELPCCSSARLLQVLHSALIVRLWYRSFGTGLPLECLKTPAVFAARRACFCLGTGLPLECLTTRAVFAARHTDLSYRPIATLGRRRLNMSAANVPLSCRMYAMNSSCTQTAQVSDVRRQVIESSRLGILLSLTVPAAELADQQRYSDRALQPRALMAWVFFGTFPIRLRSPSSSSSTS